jgi:GntR family transcriptional regulator
MSDDMAPGFSQLIGSLAERGRGPLYQKLQQALRDAIQNRVLAPDEALPPERDLAEEFAVSRITVRKALDGLVNEGLLTRRQGAGTFVASRVEKNFSKLSSFSEDMISRGRTPRSEWLKRAEGTVTPEESMVLGLSPGTPVYRFHRIRFADDAPMALEYSTVAGFSLPSAEAVGASLYEALAETGHRPTRALQRLRAVLFTAEQAALLGVQPKDPGLLIERRGFLKDGRAVEFTQSYYRGDAYDFVAELNTLAS